MPEIFSSLRHESSRRTLVCYFFLWCNGEIPKYYRHNPLSILNHVESISTVTKTAIHFCYQEAMQFCFQLRWYKGPPPKKKKSGKVWKKSLARREMFPQKLLSVIRRQQHFPFFLVKPEEKEGM
ncbi:hypothetical protein AMECASPLE_031615 [Ameca splendens]|uniref:Uncharacterized protein n=1 Tax=Ameca splendens TaxID=208324 RepID=A0ABV0YHG3_9TELE